MYIYIFFWLHLEHFAIQQNTLIFNMLTEAWTKESNKFNWTTSPWTFHSLSFFRQPKVIFWPYFPQPIPGNVLDPRLQIVWWIHLVQSWKCDIISSHVTRTRKGPRTYGVFNFAPKVIALPYPLSLFLLYIPACVFYFICHLNYNSRLTFFVSARVSSVFVFVRVLLSEKGRSVCSKWQKAKTMRPGRPTMWNYKTFPMPFRASRRCCTSLAQRATHWEKMSVWKAISLLFITELMPEYLF